ncbi:uncharacterized protein K452DRAFT_298433 [Aplosporella prunicola CBS 121167]|uniref:Uncharacterized protein n=1 Tax=Aplosporella prunicola CBS 121167 TaxID=1176127 RepID=A0A6A6BFS2_9PEZI|nr:uncharacterized protein K452DRAFT_298433 [Aplosporella prunicola CBS 121167]KAF2141767.1 hypothetical protein K452DRAFT_298433 [Aplosporella prunicola CBS 121167]
MSASLGQNKRLWMRSRLPFLNTHYDQAPTPEHGNLEISNAIIRRTIEHRFIRHSVPTMLKVQNQVFNPGPLYRLPGELLLMIMEYCIGYSAHRWLIMNQRREAETSIAIFSVCRKFRLLAQKYILPNIIWGFDFKYELLSVFRFRSKTPEKCLMESTLIHPFPDPEKWLIHNKIRLLEHDYISREIAVRLKPHNLPLQPGPIRHTVKITWQTVRSQIAKSVNDGMEPKFSRTIDCGTQMSQLHSHLRNANHDNCSIWDVDVPLPMIVGKLSVQLAWEGSELTWADNVVIIPQRLGWMIFNFRNFTRGFEHTAILRRLYDLIIRIPPHPDGKTVRRVIIRSEPDSQPQARESLQDVAHFTMFLDGYQLDQDPKPWFQGAKRFFCMKENPTYLKLWNYLNTNWRLDFQI